MINRITSMFKGTTIETITATLTKAVAELAAHSDRKLDEAATLHSRADVLITKSNAIRNAAFDAHAESERADRIQAKVEDLLS
jgi:hypothetical protein